MDNLDGLDIEGLSKIVSKGKDLTQEEWIDECMLQSCNIEDRRDKLRDNIDIVQNKIDKIIEMLKELNYTPDAINNIFNNSSKDNVQIDDLYSGIYSIYLECNSKLNLDDS